MARIILEGFPVSPGIAYGSVIIAESQRFGERRTISESEIGHELAAITSASQHVYNDLKKKLENIPENYEEYRDMLEAQMELATDARILDGARARIVKRKICAAWALEEIIGELTELFNNIPDSCVSERAQDIQAIGKCLHEALLENFSGCKLKGILAVSELTPADILNLKQMAIEAIVTVKGAAASHATILARSLKIPVVSGISDLFSRIANGEQVIVDGFLGRVILEPDADEIAKYLDSGKKFASLEESIREHARQPAITKDDQGIIVYANLESPSQSNKIALYGAEGVGLYRTECSFLAERLPTESELVAEYSGILKDLKNLPVVFRTLDVGGDKKLPGTDALEENNPALGLRGIRFSLKHRHIFKTQLRALMRACYRHAAAVMIPMLSSLDELFLTRDLIREISSQLDAENISHNNALPLGLMIETPAAAIIADELLKHCDFISIGTNDLLHYLLAIDRDNRYVSCLRDPLHPAFLRTLKKLVDLAADSGKPVSVCGEMAANPWGIVVLLGLGVRIFSTTPRLIPVLKHFLSELDCYRCKQIADEALNCFEPERIRKKLKVIVEECGEDLKNYPLEHLLY